MSENSAIAAVATEIAMSVGTIVAAVLVSRVVMHGVQKGISLKAAKSLKAKL